MAINFPSSGLTVGQIVQQADRAWTWDGEKWKATGTTSTEAVGASVIFEGSTADAFETTLTVVDPTSDRTITLKNADGTVAFTSDIPTVAGVYAPLADPTFTGTPDAPTAAADTNTTQIATTAYVQTELGAISSDSLSDADSDTKIQVEESADEDKIRFDTGGTERVVLDSSGLEIKTGNLKVPSGNGIDFSATSDAAGMTSELLDDYEEGEFTISATCQSGTITINTGNNTCAYTKVGRLVTVQGEVSVSAISSPSGQITLSGFPFVATNSATETAARCWNMGTVINTSSDVAGTPVFAIFANSSTISCFTSGTVSQDYFGGRIDTGTFFQVHGSYITDA